MFNIGICLIDNASYTVSNGLSTIKGCCDDGYRHEAKSFFKKINNRNRGSHCLYHKHPSFTGRLRHFQHLKLPGSVVLSQYLHRNRQTTATLTILLIDASLFLEHRQAVLIDETRDSQLYARASLSDYRNQFPRFFR